MSGKCHQDICQGSSEKGSDVAKVIKVNSVNSKVIMATKSDKSHSLPNSLLSRLQNSPLCNQICAAMISMTT